MRKYLHGFLVVLLLEVGIATGCADPSEQTMRNASNQFIKAVIDDLRHNPETAKYFSDAKLKDDSISFAKREQNLGWSWRWSYDHDVHFIPNPNQEAQVTEVPVFESPQGITFGICVAYRDGYAFVGRWGRADRWYSVLKEPKLGAGFSLDVGDASRDLQKKVDAIMKSHLPAFEKAVGAA